MVASPAVSKLSFTITGAQCSGATVPPARRWVSSESATRSASGLVTTIALIAGPFRSYASMRRR